MKTRISLRVLPPFVVDSIERWLSSFSGVPCPRDSDRAAQVCNYTITNLTKKKKKRKQKSRNESHARTITIFFFFVLIPKCTLLTDQKICKKCKKNAGKKGKYISLTIEYISLLFLCTNETMHATQSTRLSASRSWPRLFNDLSQIYIYGAK